MTHKLIGSYLRPARNDAERHQRGMLLAAARQHRNNIEQIFVDTAHWNRLHPDETPIDPDPDGDLRRAANELDALLMSDQQEPM